MSREELSTKGRSHGTGSPRRVFSAVRNATAKTYVPQLLTKFDLRDRVQIAERAYKSGLAQVGETYRPA
jgi:hypothetical protein